MKLNRSKYTNNLDPRDTTRARREQTERMNPSAKACCDRGLGSEASLEMLAHVRLPVRHILQYRSRQALLSLRTKLNSNAVTCKVCARSCCRWVDACTRSHIYQPWTIMWFWHGIRTYHGQCLRKGTIAKPWTRETHTGVVWSRGCFHSDFRKHRQSGIKNGLRPKTRNSPWHYCNLVQETKPDLTLFSFQTYICFCSRTPRTQGARQAEGL